MKKILLMCILALASIAHAKPVGLRNCGLTCFMNTILQCLYTHKVFRQECIAALPDPKFSALENDAPSFYYLAHVFNNMQAAAKSEEPFIKCPNGSNLKQFTDKAYQLLGQGTCSMGDAQRLLSLLFTEISDNESIQLLSTYENIKKSIKAPRERYIYGENYTEKRDLPNTNIILDFKEVDMSNNTFNGSLKHEFIKSNESIVNNSTQEFMIVTKKDYYSAPPAALCVFINSLGNHPKYIPTLQLNDYMLHQYNQPLNYQLQAIAMGINNAHWYALIKEENTWYECSDASVEEVNLEYNTIQSAIAKYGFIFLYLPTFDAKQLIATRSPRLDTVQLALNNLTTALSNLQRLVNFTTIS